MRIKQTSTVKRCGASSISFIIVLGFSLSRNCTDSTSQKDDILRGTHVRRRGNTISISKAEYINKYCSTYWY